MKIIQSENEVFERDKKRGFSVEKIYKTGVERKFKAKSFFKAALMIISLSFIFGSMLGFLLMSNKNFFGADMNQKLGVMFSQNEKEKSDSSRQQIISEDSAVIDVVSKSSLAVVSIMISKDVSTQSNGNPLDQFFGIPFEDEIENKSQFDGQDSRKQIVGNGSGFLITTDGLILTNKHVVEDEQADYTVIMEDGRQFLVKILAKDPVRDVAVLKIEGNNFPILTLGNSDSLQIGQTVIAIGDSLGEFSNSVSRGIVSGLKRNVNAVSDFGDTERLTNIIQTDAAINLGNSGGPLLDIRGDVIGINVARAQGAENIGFALPINQVKRIIDQVENGVKVSVPYLGVRYVVIDNIIKQQAGLPVDYGVLVTRGNKVTDLAVIPGSPADLAGIAENDIILEINNERITKDNQLGDIVTRYNVGDKIILKVWHRGELNEVSVKLQELKT